MICLIWWAEDSNQNQCFASPLQTFSMYSFSQVCEIKQKYLMGYFTEALSCICLKLGGQRETKDQESGENLQNWTAVEVNRLMCHRWSLSWWSKTGSCASEDGTTFSAPEITAPFKPFKRFWGISPLKLQVKIALEDTEKQEIKSV